MIRRQEAVEPKRKALEPHQRFCHILKKTVDILIEYPDYKNPSNKGKEGSIYCGNILPCYHNNIKCRYSGISPLYRDPFLATDSDMREDAASEDGRPPSEESEPSS